MRKNSKIDSLERLEHIKISIEQIEIYIKGYDSISFENDIMVQDAVLFQFSIIGEAIVFVDSEILNKYDYPWYKVRSFRNLIAHEYFNIKIAAVWNVIERDLPEMKKIICEIIDSEFL